ncbi:TMhelix containing protein [Vibrio phage 1.084.O._10N.261.49.F5]|nr:TMhelix containing protein [Vibrio phage 1.084.O._10N.261.49.F5]
MAPLIAAAIPSLIKLLPDVAGWFGGEKAENIAEDVLGIATNLTGTSSKSEALKIINQDPKVALEFQKAVMADKHRIEEMFLADKKDAREMQKAALDQDDLFSKRFIYYFASVWSLFAMSYLACITFLTIPEANTRIVDTVTGFLLGTIISAMIQFFFGSSLGSKNKDKNSGVK